MPGHLFLRFFCFLMVYSIIRADLDRDGRYEFFEAHKRAS